MSWADYSRKKELMRLGNAESKVTKLMATVKALEYKISILENLRLSLNKILSTAAEATSSVSELSMDWEREKSEFYLDLQAMNSQLNRIQSALTKHGILTPAETPETQETPEAAKTQDEPEVTDTPKTPDEPEVTDTPKTPDEPEVTDTPKTPNVPEVTDTPKTPDVPEITDTPKTPDVPEITDTQEAQATQATPKTPDEV